MTICRHPEMIDENHLALEGFSETPQKELTDSGVFDFGVPLSCDDTQVLGCAVSSFLPPNDTSSQTISCPYNTRLELRNPFWDMVFYVNQDFDEATIEKACRSYMERYNYGGNRPVQDKIMRVTRPGLTGILNCSHHASFSDAVLFGDLYIWYVMTDDLLETFQRSCTSWSLFSEFDRLLSKLCFEGFGFSIGTPGKSYESLFPMTVEHGIDLAEIIAGLEEVMKRAATACSNDLQYLDLCNAIQKYVGANAFESLERTKVNAILKKDRGFVRYGQMRRESIGQAISFEMALILRGIYVPHHLRNTHLFQDAWNAGLDFIWKANDLIGCVRDAQNDNPINAVNLFRVQHGITAEQAQEIYNTKVYEPAVHHLRNALDYDVRLKKMREEQISHRFEQDILDAALDCMAHICWASFNWNLTVARYRP